MKKILCVVLCFLAYISRAQDNDPDKVLDNLINKSVFGKGALIYFKHDVVISDSTSVKKIEYLKKDSLVAIRFTNNHRLLVPKKEFWGLITDYHERQRFYKDEIYIVWRTSAPYIYKNITTRNENTYYFSGSLTGEISPLLPGNIEPVITDTTQQQILNAFVSRHRLGQKVVYHYEPGGVSHDVRDDNGDLIRFICEVLYGFLVK